MPEELVKDKELIIQLLKKLDEQRRENSKLEAKLAMLQDAQGMQDSYEAKLKEKDVTIGELNRQMASKDIYIEWLKRKVFGGRMSEKNINTAGQLSIDFGELGLTEEESVAYEKAREETQAYHEKRIKAGQERKAKSRHGRKDLPKELPRVEEHLYPEGYNEEEWELLPDSFNEITEVLEHKPEVFYVRRYIKHKAVRKTDNDRTIKAASTPVLPIAKSYASASVLAHIMKGKYYDHLPYYRQIEMYKRIGVSLPPPTINGWFLDVADLLRPFYLRIKDLVLESDYIQADEVTIPVVDNEKNRTVKGYLWQVRAVLKRLAFFHYDKGSRSQDVAKGLFAHFRGALQTDGYAAYDMYENKSGVLTLICWAHVRRYFVKALNNDKARAEYALQEIGLLYEIERKADDEQMDYDQREQLRFDLALPILHAFEVWLKKEYPKVLPKSPIGKAISFALKRFNRLCRYCGDGRFQIDNNLIENGQRKVAQGRKNYLFCGNNDAAEDAAIMYTVMECCRINGVDFENWLTYFLNHIHEYDNDYSRSLDELLPQNLQEKGLL